MTTMRPDRDLPAILEDLYLGRTPDYRDEAMTAVARTRQRPSWTFAGRWIPMADIATSPVTTPRLRVRAIGVALLIIALALAAVALLAGSRHAKLPSPFGPAANGLIAYVSNGDILTVDPISDSSHAVTSGPEVDLGPVFSPDGTRIAFRRQTLSAGSKAEDVMVVDADGANPVVVTASPIAAGASGMEWTADSASLLVGSAAHDEVWRYAATSGAQPRSMIRNAYLWPTPLRPPDGSAVLMGRDVTGGTQLLSVDLASGRETVIAKGDYLGDARWSPDGSRVVFVDVAPGGADNRRLFLVNADGSGLRQVTSAPGAWYDIAPTWSPDGTRIAFTRYEYVASDWLVRPIGILTVATGQVTPVGPLPRDIRAVNPNDNGTGPTFGEGYCFDWAPDGTSLYALPCEGSGHPAVIDATTGQTRILDVVVEPGDTDQVWQRRAP